VRTYECGILGTIKGSLKGGSGLVAVSTP
ncbi:hypothetical protein A2U01_0055571, partial [Trifolium medium]|nr:hypothetical protein [Trifolium medium]